MAQKVIFRLSVYTENHHSNIGTMFPNCLTTILALLIGLLAAFLYQFYYPTLQYSSSTPNVRPKCLNDDEVLYTKEKLAEYTKQPDILLAFLGVVYNVTTGHYYHPDGSYAFFAGKDATRAFLNGEFDSPEELSDDVTDLEDNYLDGLDKWIELYEQKYPRVGLVIGAYYDEDGCSTKKLEKVHQVLLRLNQQKNLQFNDMNEYPPCNSHWDATLKQGKVWCTNLSGGISRSWTGKPRLFFDLNNNKQWRCACVSGSDDDLDFCHHQQPTTQGMVYDDVDSNSSDSGQTPNCRFKYYKDCDPNSTECPIFE